MPVARELRKDDRNATRSFCDRFGKALISGDSTSPQDVRRSRMGDAMPPAIPVGHMTMAGELGTSCGLQVCV